MVRGAKDPKPPGPNSPLAPAPCPRSPAPIYFTRPPFFKGRLVFIITPLMFYAAHGSSVLWLIVLDKASLFLYLQLIPKRSLRLGPNSLREFAMMKLAYHSSDAEFTPIYFLCRLCYHWGNPRIGSPVAPMAEGNRLPRKFKALFWDYPFHALTWKEDRDLIISRILTSGPWDAVVWLRSRVQDQSLKEWIQHHQGNGLSPQKLRFWEVILGLPHRQVNGWLSSERRKHWEERVHR